MGLSPGELQMNRDAGPRLFSIGHSNHDLGRLVTLLESANITAVADVRSSPFSQRLPHFSRPELEAALQQHGIGYIFLGDQLGGRPLHEELYDVEGRVDYERVRVMDWFQRGLDRLLQDAEHRVLAMMCAEEDPLDCHRGLMIAPALVERGIETSHLHGDGSIESMRAMEDRLLIASGVGRGITDGLYAGEVTDQERRQMLVEAYRYIARRKAFRFKPGERARLLQWMSESDEG
jgi:hypothetical protein